MNEQSVMVNGNEMPGRYAYTKYFLSKIDYYVMNFMA